MDGTTSVSRANNDSFDSIRSNMKEKKRVEGWRNISRLWMNICLLNNKCKGIQKYSIIKLFNKNAQV